MPYLPSEGDFGGGMGNPMIPPASVNPQYYGMRDPRALGYTNGPRGPNAWGAPASMAASPAYANPWGAPSTTAAPVPNSTPWGVPPSVAHSIPPAYGTPPPAAVGPLAANPALATTNTRPATYGPATQAFHQAANTGGMASVPQPPPRPLNLGTPNDGSSDPQGDASHIPTFSSFAKDFANTPSGSNLVQGAGSPGSGLSSFLGNIFGKQPAQGNVLGNTGGSDPRSIFSGDSQSSMPSFMKGSAISNLLQMLGIGGF